MSTQIVDPTGGDLVELAGEGRRTGLSRLLVAAAHRPSALLGFLIVLAVVVGALFANWIAPYDPAAQNIPDKLAHPWLLGGSFQHVLGTDSLGRDLLSRIIFGARISLVIGIAAVAIQATLGVTIGVLAGYYGGWIDAILMRIVDIQLGLPFLILALTIVAVIGPGLRNLIIALGLTGWIVYARTVRAEILVLRELEFVQAAIALGAGGVRVIWRHLLPSLGTSILVISSLQVPRVIVSEASLSYLGLGVVPPTPSWGGMIAEGRDLLGLAWWVAVLPGVAITLTVIGINLVAEFLRDQLDPRSHGS